MSNHKRLNIIFLICHDLGKEIGAYGRKIATPHLDSFAGKGALFTNAFCSSPACAPSRCCAYTGLPAHIHGVMGVSPSGFELPQHIPTITDHLNMAGYETAHIGFQHERHTAKENRYQLTMEGKPFVHVENGVDTAIDFLSQRTAALRPFYLNIGTFETHTGMYQQLNGLRRQVYGTTPDHLIDYPAYIPDTPELRQEMGNLQACIRFFDHHVGRLFSAITRLGLDKNTLVVVTTDHGISNERAKGTLYDRGTEIMLMMKLPGIIEPGVRNELIQNMDLAPTVLEAAGVQVPRSMYGRSFWPLLTGKPYQSHSEIFIERNFHGNDERDLMRSCRTLRHHYILNLEKSPMEEWIKGEEPGMRKTYQNYLNELWPPHTKPRAREELFDVEKDPLEQNNVAGDPAYAEVLRDLAGKTRAYMEATHDPALDGILYSVTQLKRKGGKQETSSAT